MANHRVYPHIENGGRQCVALGHPYLYAEGCTVVPSGPNHHPQPNPIQLEETKGPGTHSIPLQDTQESGPVQGILRLVKVQEGPMEDLPPEGRNLLLL